MNKNIYELFYKIIENPRCIKYYEDLANYYFNTNQEEKSKIYKEFIKKISDDSNLHSN